MRMAVYQQNNSSQPLIPYKFRRAIAPYLYLSPTIILLAMLMLFPMIVVVRYSLLDNVIMNKRPVFVGFQNYQAILTNETFRISVGNTLYFTIMSVIFHLLIGLAFALLLNSKLINSKVRSILRVFYIMPWVFTATIIAIIWRLLLNPNGIVNYILMTLHLISRNIEWLSLTQTALHAVTFINIWAGYPFYMVSILAGLQGVPGELYEAAIIDGANERQKFWHITIPQILPIIISIAMLDFIWTMQVFPLVWMTTGGGPIHATEMLSTFTYKLAFSTYKFSLASASAVIILLLSMCVALFYVKHQQARE
ncbi:binding-protein-dependent transport systems inner membrane component [Candidatus Moduliflexus flocculans]|uniref:Binding-protein-dependent transport systems inner membrane component n=1 Tax=Candidatus Moduliflexus flocculans TaxID=1499966 RepID=A0A0S6VQ77_9BACT|nr:binding-protein-dependent transport systems inner membrane component [Candidatus Moduliflexus flocculans]